MFVLIAIAAIVYGSRNIDLQKSFEEIKKADFFWVIVSSGAGIIAFVLRGLRWKMMLSPMGYEVKAINSISAVIVTYFTNLFVPRAGELARCTALYRVEKVPVEKSIGTVILERVIDLIMLLFTMLVTLIVNFELLSNFIIDNLNLKNKHGATDGNVVLYVVLVLGVLGLVIVWLFRKQLMKIGFLTKMVNGVKEGVLVIFKMKRTWLYILYSVLIWLCYISMIYMSFWALESTREMTIQQGLFVFVAGTMGFILPAPGGVGTYHAAIIASFVSLKLSKEVGATYAVIVHGAQTVLSLIAGGYAFLQLYIYSRK